MSMAKMETMKTEAFFRKDNVKCFASGCNSNKKSDLDTTFIRVPVDIESRRKWAETVGMANKTTICSAASNICFGSDHFTISPIEEDRENKIKLKLMDGRLALTNATLSQSLLNRNKMTEMEQIDVSDNSDSVDSMQSTYSQQNHSEERSYLKRVNTISEVGDKSVKSPRLEPTKLVEMTQEVKEGVEENLASFDNMFSPEINDNYFGTDFNNDIDPFQDLPDPLESIKKEPVKEGEPVAIIPNKLSPYETCAQAIQILQPNLAANDVSKFTIQLKDTDKQNEIVTSVSKKQRPVDQNSQAFPLINQISNEMIISLPTHGQKELNLINISKVVKLKQVFPRILKKTSNSICRTRYLEELNDETVSKNMGTHFEHCERKANFHDRESQVEEEFFTEVKEQNMSMETLTNVMILRSPYLYTGLYGNVFSSFLNTLIQGCNESCRDVLMTLMKIRLDESFRTLEDLFCFHNGQARSSEDPGHVPGHETGTPTCTGNLDDSCTGFWRRKVYQILERNLMLRIFIILSCVYLMFCYFSY
ncbi:uncharacterized protein LOC117172804 isoform X3 [Belonocnema kinseyi]|uniref:uncharacterized protein LOC117172804 isoform X3 n=1 Tax=Belonocnema kinseyi TaxID=2817044 RepID=UPI00143CC3BD|nr:uncharacterized protein LOC117172804 isoform X3 [Belonocnema kinseyi]